MADFNLRTPPQITRYSPLIKYGVGGFALALIGLFLWARNSQSEAKYDDRTILRQSALGFQEPKKQLPPPPPSAPELPDPQQYVEALEPPPPPPRPQEPPPPDPRIALRAAAYLKALESNPRVADFAPQQQQVAQGPQQPSGQMPTPGGHDNQRASNQQYMAGAMQKARSPYQLNAGSIIPVTLMRPVSTDAPGSMVALVSLNVFDSVTGQHLLIPQGAKVVGRYDPEMGPQARLNAVYDEIQFPNACWMSLEKTPILDVQGFAGVKDHVNRHFVQRYGAVVGLAAITAMVGLAGNNSHRDYRDYSAGREAAEGAGQVFERAVDQDLRRAMSIPATGTIRGGYPFNLDVTQTIAFTKPYDEKERCQ